MTVQAPPAEAPTTISRIEQWLAQDTAPREEVSQQTSPEVPETPEEPEGQALSTAAPESDPELPEQDADAEDADAEGDPQAIETLAQLAERIELPLESLTQLRVAGRDGREVPLSEVLSAYQSPTPDRQELEQGRQQLAQLRAREQDWVQAAEELRHSAQQMALRMRAQEPDWKLLKETNPAQYATARLEWMERERELERAADQLDRHRSQQQQQQQQEFERARADQAAKLRASRAEWADQKVFSQDIRRTAEYLMKTHGLGEQEIDALIDHRDWQVAYKAMLWDELQAKKPAALTRVRALPQSIAPGTRQPRPGASAEAQRRVDDALADLKGKPYTKERGAAAIAAVLGRSAASQAGRSLASSRRR